MTDMSNIDSKTKESLLKIFAIREEAKAIHEKKGLSDQGERASVTAGKHLNPLAENISAGLIDAGIKREELFLGDSQMEIPGWYRPTKKWDILAFSNKRLVAAIELKSITGSYGKNFNNRTEEALGSATDVNAAVKYKMFGNVIPPAFGYVMVVKDEALSRTKVGGIKEPHFKVDPIFNNNSYIDRFKIMCERLLWEKLYEAVWLVAVNPKEKTVYEPSTALSYDKFMIKLKAQVELFK